MLHYILQLVLFQLLFLLAYEVFLKKETFFSYNRWYLLITPLISQVLPFLDFDGLAQMAPSGSTILLPEVFIGAAPQETVPVDAKAVESGYQINWWWIIYFLGSLLSSILFFRKYSALKKLFQHPIISEGKGYKVIGVADSSVACTFYRTIFLGDRLSEIEKHQVLSHELVHVRQKHTLDLLFFEVQKIIFWFNPLIYIYQFRIATLHEFIADAGVVKTIEKKDYYQQLLNTAFSTENISFINQFFNHSLIKKRILMLQRSKSKAGSKLKFLVIIPLMLGMLFYVACTEDATPIALGDESLAQYEYTLKKGEEMSAENRVIHNKYEAFLKNNPDYVSWASINYEKNEITYTVHPKEEKVPEGFTKLEVHSPDGSSYVSFMNLRGDGETSANQKPAEPERVPLEEIVLEIGSDNLKANDVQFAAIEEVPVYQGCEDLSSNEAKRNCLTEKITRFVNGTFHTNIGVNLGLSGINRIYIVFRINTDGIVEVLGVRAPHVALEEEARRVINSLPKMVPGKEKGENVGVVYTLPITFMVPE